MEKVHETRLVERLYLQDESSSAPQKQRGETPLVASIKAHLRRLFSTRQGTVPASPDYGLPMWGDTEDLDLGDVCDLIKQQIERFEPRLAEVDVEPLQHENPKMVVLSVHGLVASPQSERFQLNIVLDSNIYNILS